MKLYDFVVVQNYIGKMKTDKVYLERLGDFAALYYYVTVFYDETYNRFYFSALGKKIFHTLTTSY